MEFVCEHHFPASVEQVMAMYQDVEYLPTRYRELGLRDIDVLVCNHDEQQLHVVCRFKRQASIQVPKMAQTFVGDADWLTITQTDHWDIGRRTGYLEVVIEPFKAFTTLRCAMTLEPTHQGAVTRLRWTVECSVPLIGGTLARFIAQDVQNQCNEDGAVALRLLAARP